MSTPTPSQLFAAFAWRPTTAGASPRVQTPLGVVAVAGTIDEHPLVPDAARRFEAPDGARLWTWDGGVFRAELLRCRAALALPDGYPVGSADGGEAFLWRLRATERAAECALHCRWEPAPPSAAEPAAPPAAGLALRGWHGAGHRVWIGTPAAGGVAVHHAPDGVRVSAPLAAGAAFETRFVVAWAERPAAPQPPVVSRRGG